MCRHTHSINYDSIIHKTSAKIKRWKISTLDYESIHIPSIGKTLFAVSIFCGIQVCYDRLITIIR